MNIVPTKEKIYSLERKPSHGYELSKTLCVPLSAIYCYLKEFRERGIMKAKNKNIDRRIIYELTDKGK